MYIAYYNTQALIESKFAKHTLTSHANHRPRLLSWYHCNPSNSNSLVTLSVALACVRLTLSQHRITNPSLTGWTSVVVALEVTVVSPLGLITTDTTLSMKLKGVTGCWFGSFSRNAWCSRNGADLPHNAPRLNRTHEGCILPWAEGYKPCCMVGIQLRNKTALLWTQRLYQLVPCSLTCTIWRPCEKQQDDVYCRCHTTALSLCGRG